MERNFSYHNTTTETTYCDGMVRHVPGIGFRVEAYGGEVSVTCYLAFMQSGRVDAVLIRHAVDEYLSTQQLSRHPKDPGVSAWNYDLAKQTANLLLREHCDLKSIERAASAIVEVMERGEGEEGRLKPGDMVRHGAWVCQVLRRA